MEENRIGPFIRDLRQGKGMTQQQLAEKLGVTDKAVSKWERCVSYPDITLLRELADALDVSVTELLAGERDAAPPQVPPEVEAVVLDTVRYAETARRKNGGWRFWLFVAFTAACLVAALVLFIVYLSYGRYPVKHRLLLAIKCVAFGWAVCFPLLRWERCPIGGALAVLTVGIFPFLWQIDRVRAHVGLTVCIVTASLVYLWAAYAVCRRLRRRIWRAAGCCLLLGVPLTWAIANILSARNIYSSPINLVATLLAAGPCFLVDAVLHRRHSSE